MPLPNFSFNDYANFNDYCQKTGQEPDAAFKIILENINHLSEEIELNKLKGVNRDESRDDTTISR